MSGSSQNVINCQLWFGNVAPKACESEVRRDLTAHHIQPLAIRLHQRPDGDSYAICTFANSFLALQHVGRKDVRWSNGKFMLIRRANPKTHRGVIVPPPVQRRLARESGAVVDPSSSNSKVRFRTKMPRECLRRRGKNASHPSFTCFREERNPPADWCAGRGTWREGWNRNQSWWRGNWNWNVQEPWTSNY